MSRSQFTQLERISWPSGREKAIAKIDLDTNALVRRGVTFTSGEDDLDSFLEAGLRLASGREVFLMNRPPIGYGIDVYVDLMDDAAAAAQELMSALRLDDGDMIIFKPPIG